MSELAPELTIRIAELLELLVGRATFGERLSILADHDTVAVTAANPACLYETQTRAGFASVAIVNPNNFPVYLGTDKASAKPGGSELVSIPAASWIVLPLKANRIAVGGNGQVGSVHVLVFETAQPFAAGALGAAWAD